MAILRSLVLFLVAGLCEIGGGYLIWRTLRSGGSLWLGILGGAILILYGILPTFQTASFGRVYAAYGGIFIALSILWGWLVDRTVPDRYEIIGSLIALIGVGIIMYWPRS